MRAPARATSFKPWKAGESRWAAPSPEQWLAILRSVSIGWDLLFWKRAEFSRAVIASDLAAVRHLSDCLADGRRQLDQGRGRGRRGAKAVAHRRGGEDAGGLIRLPRAAVTGRTTRARPTSRAVVRSIARNLNVRGSVVVTPPRVEVWESRTARRSRVTNPHVERGMVSRRLKGAAAAGRKPAGAFSAVGWCQGGGEALSRAFGRSRWGPSSSPRQRQSSTSSGPKAVAAFSEG